MVLTVPTTDATRVGPTVEVIFQENDKGNPPGKLADAELRFTGGTLDGLKLIGFGLWERRSGSGLNVTFPARQYSVNGERRSFALLRPTVDPTAQDRLREFIILAWEMRQEAAQEEERAANRATWGGSSPLL